MQITRPKAISIAVLVSFLMLAWYAATWLGLKSPFLWIFRVGMAILGFCAILGYWLLRSKRVTGSVRKTPSQAAPAGQASDQIGLLFRQSEECLTSSGAGKIGALPAILVLGETGSTKSTTVVQSGLEPELIGGQAFQEGLVVPTQLLNFWFARKTVFADFGGALLADQEARAALISRLKPSRKSAIIGRGAQPPRAALVCVDVESFLHAGANEATARTARAVRDALGEICQAWGINLPVYVLFTKMDRMPHFSEYVGNLNNAEAGLVLGTTLPMHADSGGGLYAEREAKRLTEVFQDLVYSLAGKRPEFLGRENDGDKLPSIYQFPREFRKLRNPLVQFLVDLCRPSQLRTNPFLRGFYFTGARAVIVSDIVASRPRPSEEQRPLLTDATGIFRPGGQPAVPEAARQSSGGRKVPQWVFLPHLFSEVILKDSAALVSSSTSLKTDFWRRALLAVGLVLALTFGIGWIVSFGNNRDLRNEALAAAQAVPAPAPANGALASVEALQRLEALRGVAARLTEYERFRPPMSLRWGLYTGHDLYPHVFRVYFGHFRRLQLNQAQESLLNLISRPAGAQALGYKPVYDALKAYLITTSNPDKSTKEFLPPVLMEHWIRGRVVDPQRLALAQQQFTYYSEVLPLQNPYPSYANPDAAAVKTARDYLSQFAAAETLYQAMLAQASQKFKTVRFNEQYPGSAEVVRNNYPVSGAFTKGGWDFMQQAIRNPDQYFSGERWVMGDQAYANLDRSRLQQDLQTAYRSDFLKQWREFLRNTSVVRYDSVSDAAGKLTTLSGNQSPLLAVLCVVSRNTAVEAPEVAAVFQPAQLVAPEGCQEKLSASSNAAYMEALIKLQASLQQLAGNTGSEPMRADTMNSATSAQVSARQLAQNFRIDSDGKTHAVVQKLLEDPITYVQNALVGIPLAVINAGGQSLCSQMRPLMAKYPFQPKATAQASLAEVNAIFQPPSSALWKLYQDNLAKLLPRQGADFVPATAGGISVTPTFLNFFQRAAGISAALYKGDAAPPQLMFSLKPSPTEGIDGVTLTINGQTMRSGASGAWQFAWPGSGPQEVRLSVKIGGTELAYPSYSGLWAVFEFFSNADRWQGSGSDASLEWILRASGGPVTLPRTGKPVTVRFDLSMGGAPPILRPGYLSTLSCTVPVVR